MDQLTQKPAAIETKIAEYSPVAAGLADLRQRFGGVAFDLTTTAGDKEARAARLELVRLRTSLEAKRKELKAPALERSRLIDEEAKRITEQILDLEEPIDEQIKAAESAAAAAKQAKLDAERKRVERLVERVDEIKGVAARAVGKPAEEVLAKIKLLTGMTIGPNFEEFQKAAENAREVALETLRELHAATAAQEAEAARIAAERADLERRQAEQAAQAEAARVEAARVAAHRAGIERMRSYVVETAGKTAAQIRAKLELLHTITIGEGWEEFQEDAQAAHDEVVCRLQGLLTDAQDREDEAARIEAQRVKQARVAAEQAERQRQLDAQAEAMKRQADELAKATVGPSYIHTATVGPAFAYGQVTTEKISDGQIVKDDLRDERSMAFEELVRNAPFGAVIVHSEVTEGELRGQVTTEKIADGQITGDECGPLTLQRPGAIVTLDNATKFVESQVPTLKVGDMNQRLGFLLTRDFVENKLGFAPSDTRGRNWGLWRESQWPFICKALANHVLATASNPRPPGL